MFMAAGILCGAALYTQPAQAAGLLDTVPAIEDATENPLAEFAEDKTYSLLKGAHLNYGLTQITRLTPTKLNMSGTTQGHHYCDSMDLNFYLERKVGASYSTYKMLEYSAKNVSGMDRSINVIVPEGYYYRIRGYHAAEDGGTRESVTTLTNGIYIG